MRFATPLRRAAVGVVLVAAMLTIVAWGWATAQPAGSVLATGELDYEPRTGGDIVESIASNRVDLTFPIAGGPFTGEATLVLNHDVPARGCQFTSTHTWSMEGDFDPARLVLAGTVTETAEMTIGACENFTFVRTFEPDVDDFSASVNPLTGEIRGRVPAERFTLLVDPARLTSLLPEPPAVSDTALDAIIDDIRAGAPTIPATGGAGSPVSGENVTLVTNEFVLDFNPLGGPVAVTGVVAFQTDQTFDTGDICSWITSIDLGGTGAYDDGRQSIDGLFTRDLSREIVTCDVDLSFEEIPTTMGTFSLDVDPNTGEITGNFGGFELDLTFDPSLVPPEPAPEFVPSEIEWSFGGDELRVGIKWQAPWPPPETGSLIVGGTVETPEGPIVFGVRLDEGTPSTFMDPPGDYSAGVDEEGRLILDVTSPGIGIDPTRIEILTWHADPPPGGSRFGRLANEIETLDTGIGGADLELSINVPFGLDAYWEQEAAVGDVPLGGEPDPGIEPPGDEQDEPVAADDEREDDGGGIPWPVFVVIPLVGIGAVVVFVGRRRRQAATSAIEAAPSAIEEVITVTSESPLLDDRKIAPGTTVTAAELEKIPVWRDPWDELPESTVPAPGDCEPLRLAWEAAQQRCDEAASRADRLSEEFDRQEERLKEARQARADLPSEETRVELPDGTSLSELDLHLRREAAGTAWDAYLADPTPETAAAAEAAWQEQATPEWLGEQRRRHEERKEQLDEDVARKQAEKDRLGEDLAEARASQRDACVDAAEAKRRYDECLAQAKPAPVPPEAGEAPPPEPKPEAEPALVPAGTPPPAEEPEAPVPAGSKGPCRDGDERWVIFDGPHPFVVPTRNRQVQASVVLVAGTHRAGYLGSLDAAPFVTLGAGRHAASIDYSFMEALTGDEVRDAFSGPGGLAAMWEPVGAGGQQHIVITLLWDEQHVMATCRRREVCVDGEWEPRPERRVHVETGRVERRDAGGTFYGNLKPGVGREESDYLAEIGAVFGRVSARIRQLEVAQESLDDYVRDCRSGRR